MHKPLIYIEAIVKKDSLREKKISQRPQFALLRRPFHNDFSINEMLLCLIFNGYHKNSGDVKCSVIAGYRSKMAGPLLTLP